MTKQEYYDLLVKSATDGTFPSMLGTKCRYRGPRPGSKCAVGLLIPDDKYKLSMEGGSVRNEVVAANLTIPDEMTIDDLGRCQDIHDIQAQDQTLYPQRFPWTPGRFIDTINTLSCFSDVKKV